MLLLSPLLPLQSAAVACSLSPASLAAQMPPLVAGPGRYRCANGAPPPTCTSAERRCSTRTGQSQRLIVLTSKWKDFLQSTTDQQLINNLRFQCATLGSAAASGRVRSGRGGGTLWFPGATCANCGLTSTVRSTHLRVRSGAA